MNYHFVWLKKDLRLFDHAPLDAAINAAKAENSFINIFYLFESDIINYPDHSSFHHNFIVESLNDLNSRLKKVNGKINIYYQNALDFFQDKLNDPSIDQMTVYAHEEIGNGISFKRDLAVRNLFKHNSIKFFEFKTNGIIRGKWSKEWNKTWFKMMDTPPIISDFKNLNFFIEKNNYQASYQIIKDVPIGGESNAHKRLEHFLDFHLSHYRQSISKPLEGAIHCSRLSSYLTFGNITIRQVYRKTMKHKNYQNFTLNAEMFLDRLLWHCHFIQRFEHFPEMEFENLNENFNQIRNDTNEVYHTAFTEGKTGIPFIDACIHCLLKTGYLNFRMRSMLISFYTHHLFQPWQNIAHFLARNFQDYEPGIHYSQIQMQAGTMGIHTIRIYNPVLQGKTQDPNGTFIKKYLPELSKLPENLIHEPWMMTAFEKEVFNINYPHPIINYVQAHKNARDLLWKIKKRR